MEINENFVDETENVEVTTEEMPKTFTQEDVDRMVKEKLDEILPGKIARREAKVRKEYESKYGELEHVLKAGTGKQDMAQITEDLRGFYAGHGREIPQRAEYSQRDIQILANAEADEIIRSGYEEVVEEVDRLAAKGPQNMTPQEKVVFQKLAQHRGDTERSRELQKLGIGADVYNSPEFKAFAGKFSHSTPISEIYGIFEKMQPKKEIHTMGSMKPGATPKVKDYYTPEEIERLTEDDLDDPKVWEAVRRSMTGQ